MRYAININSRSYTELKIIYKNKLNKKLIRIKKNLNLGYLKQTNVKPVLLTCIGHKYCSYHINKIL